MKQFKLPDVGEGLTEAEIVKWQVKPGDTVKVNQIVVEIETAKAAGRAAVARSPASSPSCSSPEGTTVDVGTPIITVDDGSAAAPAPAAPAPPARRHGAGHPGPRRPSARPAEDEAVEPGLIGGPAPGGRTSVLVGYGPKTTTCRPAAAQGRDPRRCRPRPPRSRPCRPR